MTVPEYLEAVLKSQTLEEGSAELADLRQHRDDVEKLLRTKFADSSPTMSIPSNDVPLRSARASMTAMTPEQVMQAFESNYGKLIDFVKAVPEEQLSVKRRMLSDSIPVSDILANAIMLHGLHHVYEANSRFESPV